MLGLRRIVDSLPRYARLECPNGEATLSVHESEKHDASGITLYFECEVDAEFERLRALGVEFTRDPVDQAWLWREAYTSDPNGNKICLFHAGDNRLNPPWRIDVEACT